MIQDVYMRQRKKRLFFVYLYAQNVRWAEARWWWAERDMKMSKADIKNTHTRAPRYLRHSTHIYTETIKVRSKCEMKGSTNRYFFFKFFFLSLYCCWFLFRFIIIYYWSDCVWCHFQLYLHSKQCRKLAFAILHTYKHSYYSSPTNTHSFGIRNDKIYQICAVFFVPLLLDAVFEKAKPLKTLMFTQNLIHSAAANDGQIAKLNPSQNCWTVTGAIKRRWCTSTIKCRKSIYYYFEKKKKHIESEKEPNRKSK